MGRTDKKIKIFDGRFMRFHSLLPFRQAPAAASSGLTELKTANH